jgi:hypothetical protein
MGGEQGKRCKSDEDGGLKEIDEALGAGHSIGEQDERKSDREIVAREEDEGGGVKAADSSHCDGLGAQRAPFSALTGEKPKLKKDRNDEEILLQREARRCKCAKHESEPCGHLAPCAPSADQRGIRQCADQNDLLALPELQPGDGNENECPIG